MLMNLYNHIDNTNDTANNFSMLKAFDSIDPVNLSWLMIV